MSLGSLGVSILRPLGCASGGIISPPNTLGMALSDNADGTGVTVTITNSTAGATNRLDYKPFGEADWAQAGGSFIGNTIQDVATGIGWIWFKATSINTRGGSATVDAALATDESEKATYYRIIEVRKNFGAQTKTLVLEKIERPTFPI